MAATSALAVMLKFMSIFCVTAGAHPTTSMRSQKHCPCEKPSLLHCETLRHAQRRVTPGADWQHMDRNANFEYGGVLQTLPRFAVKCSAKSRRSNNAPDPHRPTFVVQTQILSTSFQETLTVTRWKAYLRKFCHRPPLLRCYRRRWIKFD